VAAHAGAPAVDLAAVELPLPDFSRALGASAGLQVRCENLHVRSLFSSTTFRRDTCARRREEAKKQSYFLFFPLMEADGRQQPFRAFMCREPLPHRPFRNIFAFTIMEGSS
jgi:hypothetical protein